ncbi:MAG: TetR family transcriptional regulator [Myxococcota bacterium]|nr:TetR family transcriptional regulator [Myxococcota bacterium]
MGRAAIPRAEERSRREVILDATLRVIGAGGIDSVTHRRVAAEAGVPLGSIAYYFDSRDELIPAAFRHHMSGVRRTARFVEERIHPRTLASLVDTLVGVSDHYVSKPHVQHAEFEMYVYAARHPEIAEEMRLWQAELAALLAPELEALGLERPVEAARCLLGVVRGFELELLIRPDAGFDELRRRIEVTIEGLCGRSSTPARRPARPARKQSRAK